MISNDMLLNSKGFKTNNFLNSVLGGLFLILLFLPFPLYEGSGVFALLIMISVNGFKGIFEVTSAYHIFGQILLILLFIFFCVIIFFQIYNLIIQYKKNIRKKIQLIYLLCSIFQALFYIVVLLIVKIFNDSSGFNEHTGHYEPKLSSFFTIYTFILLALSLMQLIHYILILKKLKKEQKKENL